MTEPRGGLIVLVMAKHTTSKKLYQVRRDMKFKTVCTVCSKHLTRGDEGYYVSQRQPDTSSQVRCLDCGDWGADIPHRKPRTHARRGNVPAPDQVVETVAQVEPPKSLETWEVVTATLFTALADAAREAMPLRHEALDVLKRKVEACTRGKKNFYLVGPAGTGKSTLVENLAEDLGMDFGVLSLSGGTDESHLFGRLLPTAAGPWQYQMSDFVRIFEQGGVFLLDEVDAADPNVMVAVNAALANGYMSNPMSGKVHKRHKDTIIVCAANTFGFGATAQYVGRNALDAATMDRFVGRIIEVDYSDRIERKLAGSCWVLSFVRELRRKVRDAGLLRVVSTRMLLAGMDEVDAGAGRSEVEASLLVGWSDDELAAIGRR